MGIFKACDIRGIADRELTNEVTEKIAKAIGFKMSGKTVVVGGDYRLSTERLKNILIEQLAQSGCKVLDIGRIATPMLYYAIKGARADGGVMVTASHNPTEYNGFKLVLGSTPVEESEVQELAELVRQNVCVRQRGSVRRVDIVGSYIDDTSNLATPGALKLVIDAGNGAVSNYAPTLYRACGFDVVELFCEPDGNFPNRSPNPAYPQNLIKLAAKVKEVGADLGLAFDGDGDRVAFVDENGRAVDNDDILVLLAKCYLADQAGAIIYDAKCSMVVPEEIIEAGGRPIMARAGHTFSKRAFIEEKALFAGEISGHFFFNELGYDDGMFAGLKMCEYVGNEGKLSQLIDAIPNYILTKEARVPHSDGNKTVILQEITDNLAGHKLNLLDGVRLEFDDGWGMIRSSVTEPLFTLRFEAKTEERLLEIQRILVDAIPAVIRDKVQREVEKMNEK